MPDTYSIHGPTGGAGVQLTGYLQALYTKELWIQAEPLLVYADFATKKVDMTLTPGKSLVFPKLSKIPVTEAQALNELTDIDVVNMATAEKEITLTEYGYGLGFSEKLLRTAMRDVLADAAAILGGHAAKTLNYIMSKAVTWTTNVKYGGGKSARGDLVAADKLTTTVIKNAVQLLSENNAPKFAGDFYIGFVTPWQGRCLRDDPNWISVAQYAAPGNLLTGEIGMYERVRFIETTMQPIIQPTTGRIFVDGTDTGATTTPGTVPVHCATIFGDNGLGWAEALAPEIRDGGIFDFGRRRKLAWYAIWGVDRITEDYFCRIETA